MVPRHPVHPHDKFVVASGALTIAGLVTGLVYTLWSTPYTMVLFLGLGQASILAGIAVLLAVVVLDLRARIQSLVVRRFQAGDVVFRQGDFPDRLYLIGRGEVDVIRTENGKEAKLATMRAGEFFGEIGILGHTPRTATVRAATDVETLSIHRDYFGPLLEYLPAWRERVFDEYRRRGAGRVSPGEGTP